jgi:hypothetical protein
MTTGRSSDDNLNDNTETGDEGYFGRREVSVYLHPPSVPEKVVASSPECTTIGSVNITLRIAVCWLLLPLIYGPSQVRAAARLWLRGGPLVLFRIWMETDSYFMYPTHCF